MGECTEHIRLRVVTENVRLPDISVPVPKGEYDGYIDWQKGLDGERHMAAIQLIIGHDALAQMGRSEPIPSMGREVLRYFKQGDIERV